MPKFRSNAWQVEAERWEPGDPERDRRLGVTCQPGARIGHRPGAVGAVLVNPGDWVVKDEGGEVTICPDAEFRRRFGPVDG